MSSLIIALFYQHDHRIVLFAQVEQGGDGGIVFGFGVLFYPLLDISRVPQVLG